jgi:hypothetical protein
MGDLRSAGFGLRKLDAQRSVAWFLAAGPGGYAIVPLRLALRCADRKIHIIEKASLPIGFAQAFGDQDRHVPETLTPAQGCSPSSGWLTIRQGFGTLASDFN